MIGDGVLGYVSLGFVKAKSCLEKMYIFGGGHFFTVWDVYVVMGCFVCKSFFYTRTIAKQKV